MRYWNVAMPFNSLTSTTVPRSWMWCVWAQKTIITSWFCSLAQQSVEKGCGPFFSPLRGTAAHFTQLGSGRQDRYLVARGDLHTQQCQVGLGGLCRHGLLRSIHLSISGICFPLRCTMSLFWICLETPGLLQALPASDSLKAHNQLRTRAHYKRGTAIVSRNSLFSFSNLNSMQTNTIKCICNFTDVFRFPWSLLLFFRT